MFRVILVWGASAGLAALLSVPDALAAGSAYSRFDYENCARTGEDDPIIMHCGDGERAQCRRERPCA